MKTTYPIPLAGLSIGHAEDSVVKSGATTFLFDQPTVTAVHIMGAAPGTRETELLGAENTVDKVDAISFAGGSAFGLDAGGGVQAWLKEQGRGIQMDPVRIPIVPCAILFDLRNGGNKEWGRFSPYRQLGYEATCNHSRVPSLGTVGASMGANTATGPGGFGMAHTPIASGTIFAAAAVNAAGSAHIADTHHYWAAPFEENDEFGGYGYPNPWPQDAKTPRSKSGQRVAGANTTLGFIATDICLNAAQAKRIAIAAHDGFARALYPVHTPADGDLIFVSSTQKIAVDDETLMDVGIYAANTMSRAIARGVYEARPV